MRPQGKISTRWSPGLAYAIGLIVTDGCLSKDGRHINLTSKDLCQVRTFKKCLGLKNKVGLKSSGFVKNRIYYNLQFGDVLFYKFLLNIGLTPAKSKTIKGVKVPNKYFADFLRGIHDGDGSFYSYWDRRWHSSFLFYLVFISASLAHLEWLQSKMRHLYGPTGHIVKTDNARIYQLKYAKTEAEVIIKKIYYATDVPKLARKFRKIQAALIINSKHT